MSAYESLCDCCHKPTSQCAVLLEFRDLNAPGGRERAMARYREELAARAAQLDGGGTRYDKAKRLQAMGVPGDAIASLEDPQPTPALDAAKSFVRQSRNIIRFLLLLGPVGVGKSVAAAWTLAQASARWNWNSGATGTQTSPGLFVSASRLTRLANWGDVDQAFRADLERAPLLVLDDVGDESSEIGRNALTDLLLRRAESKRTVITSNLSADAFKSRYGEALADRIRATGIIPTLPKGSMRKRAAL